MGLLNDARFNLTGGKHSVYNTKYLKFVTNNCSQIRYGKRLDRNSVVTGFVPLIVALVEPAQDVYKISICHGEYHFKMSLDMFYRYFTILYVIIVFLTQCLAVPLQPTVRLAFITDVHSSSNWTGVFQRALTLDDKLSYLRHEVKFEFFSVSKRDLQSFVDILDVLCQELLPRQVHAVFLSAESSVAYEFTKFIGLVPVLILGTKRDPAFENQVSCSEKQYM